MREQSGSLLEMVHTGPVDERVTVALRAGAHVDTSFHLEVAVVSPSFSPGVLDVPELLAVLDTVAGSQDCVVDVFGGLAAVVGGIDSALVILEPGDDLVSQRNGASIVDSFGEFGFITFSHVVAAESDISNGNLFSEVALTILGSVGIGNAGLKATNMSDVLKSMRGEPSVAAMVIEVTSTINELLFSEGKVSTLTEDVPVRFHATNGREGPARSASSLILDGAHHSEVVPFVSIGNSDFHFLLDLETIGG